MILKTLGSRLTAKTLSSTCSFREPSECKWSKIRSFLLILSLNLETLPESIEWAITELLPIIGFVKWLESWKEVTFFNILFLVSAYLVVYLIGVSNLEVEFSINYLDSVFVSFLCLWRWVYSTGGTFKFSSEPYLGNFLMYFKFGFKIISLIATSVGIIWMLPIYYCYIALILDLCQGEEALIEPSRFWLSIVLFWSIVVYFKLIKLALEKASSCKRGLVI